MLDACRDDTGEVALRFATAAAGGPGRRLAPAVDLAVVEVATANVGLARAAGCDDVLGAFSGTDPSRCGWPRPTPTRWCHPTG